MNWDKRYLEGKVYTEGAVESATKYVPKLRAKGRRHCGGAVARRAR